MPLVNKKLKQSEEIEVFFYMRFMVLFFLDSMKKKEANSDSEKSFRCWINNEMLDCSLIAHKRGWNKIWKNSEIYSP